MATKIDPFCQFRANIFYKNRREDLPVGGKRLAGNVDVTGSVQAQLALQWPIHVGVKEHQCLLEVFEGYNGARLETAMPTARMTDDDGTVEISEAAYRYLIGALRTISADNYSCCTKRARPGGHSPSCPVAIARKAVRDAIRAGDACQA